MSWIQNTNKIISDAERIVTSQALQRIASSGNQKGRWKGYDANGQPSAVDKQQQTLENLRLSYNTALPLNTVVHLDSLNTISQQSNFLELEALEAAEAEIFDDDFFLMTRGDGFAAIIRLRRRKNIQLKRYDANGQYIDSEFKNRFFADMVVLSYGASTTIELDDSGRKLKYNQENIGMLFDSRQIDNVLDSIDNPDYPGLFDPLANVYNRFYGHCVRPWDFAVTIGNGYEGGSSLPIARNGYAYVALFDDASSLFETELQIHLDVFIGSLDFSRTARAFGNSQSIDITDTTHIEYYVDPSRPLLAVENNRQPDLSFDYPFSIEATALYYLVRENVRIGTPPPGYIYDFEKYGYGPFADAELWTVRAGAPDGPVLVTMGGNNDDTSVPGFLLPHNGALDFKIDYPLLPSGTINAYTHPGSPIFSTSYGPEDWEFCVIDSNTNNELCIKLLAESYFMVTPGLGFAPVVGSYQFDQDVWTSFGSPDYQYLMPVALPERDSDGNVVDYTSYLDVWNPDFSVELSRETAVLQYYNRRASVYNYLTDTNYVAHRYNVNTNLNTSRLVPDMYGGAIIVHNPEIAFPKFSVEKKKVKLWDNTEVEANEMITDIPSISLRKKWDFTTIPVSLIEDIPTEAPGHDIYTSEYIEPDPDEAEIEKIRPGNTFTTYVFDSVSTTKSEITLFDENLYYWPYMSIEIYGEQLWIGRPDRIGGKVFESPIPPPINRYPCLWSNWKKPEPLTYASFDLIVISVEETEKYKTDKGDAKGQFVEWSVQVGSEFQFRYGLFEQFKTNPFGLGTLMASSLGPTGEPLPFTEIDTQTVKRFYHPSTHAILGDSQFGQGSFAKGRRKFSSEQTMLNLSKTGELSIVRPVGESRPKDPIWPGLEDTSDYLGKVSFPVNVFRATGILDFERSLQGRGPIIKERLYPEIYPLPLAAQPFAASIFKNINLDLTASKGRIFLGEL